MPRRSKVLNSVEESSEWADKGADQISPASYDHVKFYKRTRPIKDSRELSSPKNTGETFPKAKEQHHSPKKTESQQQEAVLSRSGMPQTQTKMQSTNLKKIQVRQPVISTLQHTEHHQDLHRGLKDSSRRENVGNEKKNGKGGNLEIRTVTHERGERTELGHQEPFKRRVIAEFPRRRTFPNAVKESGKGPGKDSGRRDINDKGQTTKYRNRSRSVIDKTGSWFFKDIWSRKDSVGSLKEIKEKEGKLSNSKEDGTQTDFVASVNHLPVSPHSLKGSVSPGPWKVPSSAKILSEAEVLRDPL